jgi:hypothetical protein
MSSCYVGLQEAPPCGANLRDSVVPFPILASHPWLSVDLRTSPPKCHHSLPWKKTDLLVGKLSLDFWVHAIEVVLLGWSILEGRFAWLMMSSKLQSCLELCQFIQAFLKPGLQNRKHAPFRLARVFNSWPSSEQDGVLLEIRNWNEESCVRSLIATTSLDLVVISLPRCQTLLNTSITMFIPSPFIMT